MGALLEDNLNSIIHRDSKLIFTHIDDEMIMLNPGTGEYIALNHVASRIWEIIEDPISISDLINILMDEFEVTKEECTKDTLNCILEFRKLMFIS